MLNSGVNAKMNPPLRTDDDVQAIKDGLADGTIDAIATDHAPHHADEKQCEFAAAQNGIIGFETALGLGITYLVKENVLTLGKFLEKMTANPANILGLNKGTLRVGTAADIVIFSPDKEYEVKAEEFESKSKNSPYDGWKLYGKPQYTIVRGHIIVNQGVLL